MLRSLVGSEMCIRDSLNPPDEKIIEEADRVLVLAEDDSTYSLIEDGLSTSPSESIPPGPVVQNVPGEPDHRLFCGWRRDIGDMIRLLDEFVQPGSTLTILCEESVQERQESFEWQGRDMTKLVNLTLIHVVGNPTIRHHLQQMEITKFCSILILADARDISARDSDSHTLAAMLLIRDIQCSHEFGQLTDVKTPALSSSETKMLSMEWFDRAKQMGNGAKIACEVLESHTKRLQTLHSVSEYIMSYEMLSKYIAMISEDPHIHPVLEELFCSYGNEIYIRDVSHYVHPREQISFYGVAVRARRRREVLLGFRCPCVTSAGSKSQIVLNPPDESKRAVRLWDDGSIDGFIVFALDNDELTAMDDGSPRRSRRSSLSVSR
eukprot:TRINITY_DN54544_c0_g1_i3.p1 TRINITY_DN54544_c0_g1~~TRINITY_DN54544_c0_g1_i3.p1  ORF type:complete len:379 (-),score=111.48 TRINITY_DN54544_c0_g1_i3:224-1360(-)